ncbi:MAG: ATP-binding protein [Tateyamaria sp.]
MPQRSSTTAQSDDRCEQMLTVSDAVGGDDPAILGQAFHASPYASFIVSSDGLVLHHNRRAGRLYVDDQDGRAVPLPFAALTDLRDAEMLQLLRQGAARGYLDAPMIVTSRSKQRTPTVFRVAVLRARSGGDHLYLLTQDHLKSAAEALGQMNKRRIDARNDLARSEARFVDLHASLLAMESFAYKASHDLRTPLNTLSGLMDLFVSQFGNDLPDKARDYLSFMTRAVGQMDALTNDFLEHARSASAELAAEPLDLGTVLRDVRRDLQDRLCGADLTIEIGTESCKLLAEPTLLHMMLTNIFANALKYHHPDRALRISVAMAHPDDQTVELTIKDNGRGFDPSQRQAIFQPFRRLDNSVDGTGMGLSTCAEVCRRHGWSISAQSDGQSGAAFVITFPKLAPSSP